MSKFVPEPQKVPAESNREKRYRYRAKAVLAVAGSFALLLSVMLLGSHVMLMFPLVPSLVAAVLGVACLVSSALDYARSTRVELPAAPATASARHGEDSSQEEATPKPRAVVPRHAA